ncbi:ABC transporter substrate-binding protein [Pigmentiphaga kullae]|uniref:Amino acid/amide ABC transporter substrate-binding protein (HAAT family) n=1 Tax=Pigmentiphaga kullae TaxID=151784 RepID=A0A4Q7NPB6_9BURK|nr:ABC transporter substrate-binding protein [Pigmentiphaga kullae]RZS86440.1 amino acid/amide ABC transporter substrate-binding protein (HAAT family) [Pigmentiphaga kullae]
MPTRLPFRRLLAATAASGLLSAPALAAESPITIGLFTHLSGNFAEYGASFKNAVELYLDKVNADGGVNGRPVRLVVEDDRNSPQEAATVARKIVATPGVVLAIGSWSTTASLAAAPIFTEARIAQISPTSSHPDFSKQSPYQFRQNNTDDVLAQYNADTIHKQLKASRIVIPYSQDDWGLFTVKATSAAIEKDGGKVLLTEAVMPNARDFRPLVSKIKSLKPDGVFLALPYQEASIFIQQLRQAGVDIPVGGGVPLTSPKFIELAGKAAEGVVVHSIFFAGDPSKKAFVDAYRAKYNRTPDQFAALAYDAAGVGVAAIRRVVQSGKPLTGQSVRDELAGGPAYEGVTGVTKYENGNVRKAPTFLVIRNGEFQLNK